MYSYDESTSKIWLLFPGYFYNNYAGLKVLYGDTAMAHGDSDAGGHIEVSYIRDFPYTAREVQITGADGDGTVHFTFRNQDITLKPGENWTCDTYSAVVDVPGEHGPVKLNSTRVDTFTNYGLFDLSRVEGS